MYYMLNTISKSQTTRNKTTVTNLPEWVHLVVHLHRQWYISQQLECLEAETLLDPDLGRTLLDLCPP